MGMDNDAYREIAETAKKLNVHLHVMPIKRALRIRKRRLYDFTFAPSETMDSDEGNDAVTEMRIAMWYIADKYGLPIEIVEKNKVILDMGNAIRSL